MEIMESYKFGVWNQKSDETTHDQLVVLKSLTQCSYLDTFLNEAPRERDPI